MSADTNRLSLTMMVKNQISKYSNVIHQKKRHSDTDEQIEAKYL